MVIGQTYLDAQSVRGRSARYNQEWVSERGSRLACRLFDDCRNVTMRKATTIRHPHRTVYKLGFAPSVAFYVDCVGLYAVREHTVFNCVSGTIVRKSILYWRAFRASTSIEFTCTAIYFVTHAGIVNGITSKSPYTKVMREPIEITCRDQY
jgi:hypothetical protein